MNKKGLYIIGLIILLIIGFILFFNFNKSKNLEYHILSSDKQKKSIRIGMPKDKGFTVKKNERGIVEFWNDEKEYRVEIALRDILQSSYDANLESHREDDGFKEIVINKFKGYEYSSVSFGRHIYLNLGEGENGLYDIVYIYVGRIANYNQAIDEILEFKEVKSILKSLKVVNYTTMEEVEDAEIKNDGVDNTEAETTDMEE